jgi:hypothetical protein
MAAKADGIPMWRDFRAFGIPQQIHIKRQRPPTLQQQHFVVPGILTSALPAKGGTKK